MIGWAIETFVATTLLMLLVLAIRAPVRRAFGAPIAYALWLLPVARLLLPPVPAEWHEQAVAPVAAASDIVAYYVVDAIDLKAAPASVVASGVSIDWIFVALLVWAAGALLFLVYHLIAHYRHTARLLRAARVDRTVADGRVRVIETDAAHGPLAFGVFRKYIAFPRDFSERYDALEQDLALAHELGHHARGDLLANWAALIFLALHWFNPIAWWAFRAFRADQEMACDALVLAGRAYALRHAYGRAIVKSAHGGAVSAACHLHTINEVKGRLRMLSKSNTPSRRRLVAGLAGVGTLGLAALGITASGTATAEKVRNKVETTIVTVQEVALPAPAAPPAAPAAPPAAPAAPPARPAMAAPAAPPAPPAPLMQRHADGSQVKKIIIERRDGTREERDMPDMLELHANVPEIRNEKCGAGKTNVIHRQEGGKRIMIICEDRIAHVAANAERVAQLQAERSNVHALMGLRSARSAIENNPKSSADEGQKALWTQTLWAIDQAINELEKQRN